MDTWSALVLCHENTKMTRVQPITFCLGRDRPPSLLTFEKSVAERHVENLKIMRNVGAKGYAEACRELTTEETFLRQKVYNYYNGPGTPFCSTKTDCFYWSMNQKIEGVTTWFGRVVVVPFPFTLVTITLCLADFR